MIQCSFFPKCLNDKHHLEFGVLVKNTAAQDLPRNFWGSGFGLKAWLLLLLLLFWLWLLLLFLYIIPGDGCHQGNLGNIDIMQGKQ